MEVLSWTAPNFFSRRQTLTRSLACLAGRLKSKKSQEVEISGEIDISFRDTCNSPDNGNRTGCQWFWAFEAQNRPKNLELFINREPEETLEVIDAARGIKVRRKPGYVVDRKGWCRIKDIIDTKGHRGICD